MRQIHARRIVTAAVMLSVQFCSGEWVKIDDFQGYPPDALPMQANGWMTADDKASQVTVCADTLADGNQAARLHRREGTKSGEHDILYQNGALAIEPGKTGTVFMRFLVESGLDKLLGSTRGEKPVESIHLSLAVTEQQLHAGNPRFGVTVQYPESLLWGFGAKRPEGKPLPLRRNRWYRLWLVVDNRSAEAGGQSKAFLQEEGASGKPEEVCYALEASPSYQPESSRYRRFSSACICGELNSYQQSSVSSSCCRRCSSW